MNQNDRKYNKAPIDLNFPSLPMFNLLKRKSNKLCGYESPDGNIGISFFKGKPSTNAQKIIIYLISKAPRKEGGAIGTDILREHGVMFTYAELCEYLGVTNTTLRRRQIKEDLVKLGYTTIYLHKRWIEKKEGQEMGYSTIEQVQPFKIKFYDLETAEKNEQLPLWVNVIKFDEILLKNLEESVFRLIDTEKIRDINSPTALRIYGIVSLHNQSEEWKIGLKKLAEQIPLQTERLRDTKAEIKKACGELIELGLIRGYEIYKNKEGEEIIAFSLSGK